MGLLNLFQSGAAIITEAQTTSISEALTTAIGNTLDTFISLLPIFAVACGTAFAIRFVTGLFNKTKKGK